MFEINFFNERNGKIKMTRNCEIEIKDNINANTKTQLRFYRVRLFSKIDIFFRI